MTDLRTAVADASSEAQEQRMLRIAALLRDLIALPSVRQVDLIKETGLSREHVRRLIEDERIRRGEIEPTKRYLDAQARKVKRSES